MKGTERGPDGKLRYFYQYKTGGPKYYYKKSDNGRLRIPFQRPFIPKYDREQSRRQEQPRQEYREYVPQQPQSKLEIEFNRMHPNVKALISRWLLIFGFQSIKDISTVSVNKTFRQLSLIHHPDRGGSEDNYKELSSVREHLITLCSMADVLN
jgi:hypothetical protein